MPEYFRRAKQVSTHIEVLKYEIRRLKSVVKNPRSL